MDTSGWWNALLWGSSMSTWINSQPCHAIMPLASWCMMHDPSYCFATPMSLYYKFVAVHQEGSIPPPCSAFICSFPRHWLVSTEPCFSGRIWAMILSPPVALCTGIAFMPTQIFSFITNIFKQCTLTWILPSLPLLCLLFPLLCLPQLRTGTEI